jgi:phosphoenolpyruvate carboxykinase (ATP)
MMQFESGYQSTVGLDVHGIKNINNVYWNLSTGRLYEEAIRRREGRLAHLGPLVVRTGQHTGRSPNDKFIVREPSSEKHIWWGKVNQPMDESHFSNLYRRLLAYLQGKDLFVQDCFVGADPSFQVPIRIITETAWHSLFARNMFIQARKEQLVHHKPEFTVINAPNFHADPDVDMTRSEVFIVIHFGQKLILIGGTQYAGEIKKSIFSLMNYILPLQGILSMHCSANAAEDGNVAIFFGLSGTGKTTLSADSQRILIGDDEHGWSDQGIFNFEGGCYAKVIRLSPIAEPEIYETTRRFGTILENVTFDSVSGRLDLSDDTLTENTRAAYPISHIPNATREGLGKHPDQVILLTADAFGVLPPVACLTPDQAMYHFLSGYTARVAGTEKGVKEPSATFSACFGAPFLPLSPVVYAKLFGEKIIKHHSKVWLVNTGWTGGPYGVGHRIPIAFTRAMVHSILNGILEKVSTHLDPVFGLAIPVSCPDVPSEMLNPRTNWADKRGYDDQVLKVAALFQENFKVFTGEVSREVLNAGPRAE